MKNPLNPIQVSNIKAAWLQLCVLFACMFCVYGASAQTQPQPPVANFTSNRTEICAGSTISFTDQSTNNPTSWSWEFGNGTLSTSRNPTVSYTVPGTYTVKLTVTNAAGVNGITRTDYITVFPAPVVNFSANRVVACTPAAIQFTDLTNAPGNDIVGWAWDFGDGTTSTQQNPVKTYSANGYYTVRLTVTTTNNCQITNTKTRYIRVIGGVTPNFDFNRANGCSSPVEVKFTNQSTGPGVLTYNWNFQGAGTSTQEAPTAAFASTGTYNVKLVVASSFGCADSITRPIEVVANVPDFEAPASACAGKNIQFTNLSNPEPSSVQWDFGDGTFSSQINPTKTYVTNGTYTVTLRNIYANCDAVVTKTINITNIGQANFTTNDSAGCRAPHTVQFTESNPNAVAWEWELGDGATSVEQNPLYTYLNTGNYTVTLRATTAEGCVLTQTKTDYIKVNPPIQPTVQNMPIGGCVPYTFTPQINPAAIPDLASIEWDFGAGAGRVNSLNPSFTYSNTGTYSVTLYVQYKGGCRDTLVYNNGVRVGTRPQNLDFTINRTEACAGDTILFTSSGGPADNWSWNFGDGGRSSSQNPRYLFQDTGLFTVQLIASNNGCRDSVSKVGIIKINAPVARFDYEVDCINRRRVTFDNNTIIDPSHGTTTYLWTFGDGNSSTQRDPVHTYAAYGTYLVTLVATDPVCSYTHTTMVTVFPHAGDVTVSKPIVCRNENFLLQYTGVNPELIRSYSWQIEGQPATPGGRNFNFSLANGGTYDVTVTYTDIYNCTHTITKTDFITVIGSTANFNVTNNGGCVNSSVTINDQSNPSGAVTQWIYQFGDGTSDTTTSTTVQHVYTNPGYYTIKLTTLDVNLCVDTITKPASAFISRPRARFSIEETLSCPRVPIQFRNTSTGNGLTYLWEFGDGNTETSAEPAHPYDLPDTTVSVKLTVTDNQGCVDSIKMEDAIRIVFPSFSMEAFDTSSICPPLEAKFAATASNFDSLYWDFGNGATSTLPSTNYFYNNYGSYVAKLHVIGYGGCRDSIEQAINVYNPISQTTFNYNPTENCNSIDVTFNVQPPPNTKFYLIFNDGSEDSSQANIVQHTYAVPSIYRPFLRIIDSLDCQVGYGSPVTIMVKGVIPAFNIDKRQHCDSGVVKIDDFSIGNDPVTTRTWDFGDGNGATNSTSLTHRFAQPGEYRVTQHVTTSTGCENTYADTVRIYRTPQPVITSPDEVCIFEPINLAATTVVPDTATVWRWSLGNGQTSGLQNVGLRYTNSGNTTVTLRAGVAFGCENEITKNIMVNPLPIITNPPEVSIPIGIGTNLPISYEPSVNAWSWSPADGLSCTTCPTPFAEPASTTNYRVTAIDTNGCRSVSSIVVKVLCEGRNFFIPNTFSPNNDGNNDYFYPRGTALDRVQSMRIFNRWGELVFERKNFVPNAPTDGWNGMIRGKAAASDTYVFMIEIICDNGQTIPIKGNVTLIR